MRSKRVCYISKKSHLGIDVDVDQIITINDEHCRCMISNFSSRELVYLVSKNRSTALRITQLTAHWIFCTRAWSAHMKVMQKLPIKIVQFEFPFYI